MSMEQLEFLGLVFIWVGAIASSLFVILYPIAARGIWWREPSGRALMTSSVGLALLLDLTLLFRVVTLPPYESLVIVLVVVGIVSLGACLKVGALVHEWILGRRR